MTLVQNILIWSEIQNVQQMNCEQNLNIVMLIKGLSCKVKRLKIGDMV